MKLFETSCEFQYPWDQVTAANWRKYPNEVSTHVVAVDVLRRELDSEKMVLTTERLITCKQSVPKWLLYIVGGKEVSYIREVSTVDMNTRTLTLRSVNLTMCNLLRVFETVTYKPDSTNSNKTIFKQEAQITAYAALQRICNKIEDWSVERFGENAKKGKLGFESVLALLNEQWERKEQIVGEITESFDKVVKTVDSSLDTVVKTVDVSIGSIKDEIVKETDKILNDAEKVKKSLLSEYYDVIKAAFKRNE